MPRNKGQSRTESGTRGNKGSSRAKKQERAKGGAERRDEANKHRFVDQSGLAAQDLPDAAHGQNVVDPPEEMTRNLPQQYGGEVVDDPGAEGGLRGARDISDADIHGGRKRN
jgi:hypothetical protein